MVYEKFCSELEREYMTTDSFNDYMSIMRSLRGELRLRGKSI